MARTMSHFEHKMGFKWVPFGVRSKDNVLPVCLSRWIEPGMPEKFYAHLAELGIVDARECRVPSEVFDLDFRFRSDSVSG